MLIQHLENLKRHGLKSSIAVSVIEIEFNQAKAKSGKIEIPYSVVAHNSNGSESYFYGVDKIDPSNYITASAQSRRAILTDPTKTFFKGIPVHKNKTQTASLVKLLWWIYRSAWYAKKINEGILDAEDGCKRCSSLPGGDSAKTLSAKAQKEQRGAELPVIGKTKAGLVVLGIKEREPGQPKSHFNIPIDEETSIELTRQILETEPNATGLEGGTNAEPLDVITLELQTKKGRARNLYGDEKDIQDLSKFGPAETARVFGVYERIDLGAVRAQYNELESYDVQVGENPDSTALYFVALQPEQSEEIKAVVRQAKEDRRLAAEAKKNKRNRDDEAVNFKAHLLPLPKRYLKAKVLLGNKEGKKSFLLLNEVFPNVPVYYWQNLNQQLPEVQWPLIGFNQTVRSGPDSSLSPSSYALWTEVFTSAALH
jgi:hypothetical protein